jgi:hypothetical protein
VAIQFLNSQILFVNGAIAMDPACCCDGETVPCQVVCVNNVAPAQLQVEISGIETGNLSDPTKNCSACNGHNGTYIANQLGSCCWSLQFSQVGTTPPCCLWGNGYHNCGISICVSRTGSPGNWTYWLYAWVQCGTEEGIIYPGCNNVCSSVYGWRVTQSEPFDCLSWDHVALARYTSDPDAWYNCGGCYFKNMTIAITSL